MNLLALYLLILLALRVNSITEDTELLTQIRSGNHNAFKKFFDIHHPYLYYFLLKKGISEQYAEDLVQQAFILVWENRKQINPHKSLRAYLYKIAYNRMLNIFRDHSKFDDQADTSETKGSDIADSNIENKELAMAIEMAIKSMPEKRQTVFRLCFIQGFTYNDAAEVLEISAKTIENHIGLALKELRIKLKGFRYD